MNLVRNIVIIAFALYTVIAISAENQAIQETVTLPKIKLLEKNNITTTININTSDANTLHKIKGISKKKAQAIINYRNKNGAFKSIDDLLKIKFKGINKKWLDKTAKFISV